MSYPGRDEARDRRYRRQREEELEDESEEDVEQAAEETDDDSDLTLQQRRRIERQEAMAERAQEREGSADDADGGGEESFELERPPRPEGGVRQAERERLEEQAPEQTPEREAAADVAGDVLVERDGEVRPTDLEFTAEELNERERQRLRERIAERENVDPERVEFREEPTQVTAELSDEGEDRVRERVENEQAQDNAEQLENAELAEPVESPGPTRRSTQPVESPEPRDVAREVAYLPAYPIEAFAEGERELAETDVTGAVSDRLPDSVTDRAPELGAAGAVARNPTAGRVGSAASRATFRAAGVLGAAGVTVYGADQLSRERDDLQDLEPTASAATGAADELEVPEQPAQEQPELEVDESTVATDAEIEVSEETRVQPESEVEPAPQQVEDELDVQEPVVEEEIPLGESGDDPGTGGGREDTVVDSDYPLPGRDFPADPSREYVPGAGPNIGLSTTALEQTGVLEESRQREPAWERRRRRSQRQRELDEILRGPDEEVTLGRERPDWSRFRDWEPFRFPGEAATGAAASEQFDVEPEVDAGTSTSLDAGVRPRPRGRAVPAVDSALDVGTDTTPDYALPEQALEATAEETAYPSEFANPSEYGYGYETAPGNRSGRSRRPFAPPLPDIDLGDELAGDPAPTELTEQRWETPVAPAEAVWEDLTDDGFETDPWPNEEDDLWGW